MTDNLYHCPFCKKQLSDNHALPCVFTRYCPDCEKPFVVVAFMTDGEWFCCCLSLDERTMQSSDRDTRVRHVMNLVEPYLPLMGVSATYRDTFRAAIAQQVTPNEVTPEEFAEEGLFDPSQGKQTDVSDWRTGWICECRYCGCEITSGWSVFPPTFRFKSECPNCHKRLEIRVTYPNSNSTLPQALLPPARMIAHHPRQRSHDLPISDDDVSAFRKLLKRKDLGFPGGSKKQ